MGRVLGATPKHATRMGAALRHSGYRLSQIGSAYRIIILITDGKPNDSGYDALSGYAHHDVRMACEENRRNGIHTVCISTNENLRTEMECMFPGRRYVIVSDFNNLVRILPHLYIKMTL
jgi:nitric oxide reductase activation protein